MIWEDFADLTVDDWRAVVWFLAGAIVVCTGILAWFWLWPPGGRDE